MLFVLLQQLRLTNKFSFMVLCIIACISKIWDFVLFLFVLIVFLTVSFSNLGYDADSLSDKFNIYFANGLQMFKMALGES